MFLSSIIIPRALCRGSLDGSSVSSVSSGTTTAIVATDIVTFIIILMHCFVSNQMGFWAPMKLLRSACGLTDSECMHIPTEGPCTLRVQLHCNNNNKIVINGHFFVSGISIYFCIVCYVEFVLLQNQRIIIYYAILMVIHSSPPPPAHPWCGFDVMSRGWFTTCSILITMCLQFYMDNVLLLLLPCRTHHCRYWLLIGNWSSICRI